MHRYEIRLALEHLSYADLRRSPATWALGSCPVFVTAGSCQPEIPLLVWREDGPFLQELLPGFALPPKAPVDTAGRSIPAFFLPAGIPCGLAARLPSARHLRALPCSGPDGHAVAMGRGGAPHEPHPHLSGRGEVQGAQRKVQRIAFFAFLKL